VKGLKDKFEKNLRVHEQDNNRIMIQNVDLISEINDLKREKKNLKDELKRKTNQVKQKSSDI
jgi:phosphoenolpyruvate-protein kinase (PTS system EI component)